MATLVQPESSPQQNLPLTKLYSLQSFKVFFRLCSSQLQEVGASWNKEMFCPKNVFLEPKTHFQASEMNFYRTIGTEHEWRHPLLDYYNNNIKQECYSTVQHPYLLVQLLCPARDGAYIFMLFVSIYYIIKEFNP